MLKFLFDILQRRVEGYYVGSKTNHLVSGPFVGCRLR